MATIEVKAGDGGNGRLSFLHEKYKEYGGPDGGDGGRGGDIIVKAGNSCNTLYFYKTHKKIVAERGEEGKPRKKHGQNGESQVIIVPVGTFVYNQRSGKLIADLANAGSEVIVAHGGEGGYGNAHFTSSTRQTPQFAELGLPGDNYILRLELKLIADVGLLGLPNIGKSTFLSVATKAKPKIADYPFTTITPNLGVVEGWGTKGFIIADIPGIIEGAAKGKGLGEEFLRHLERTRLALHFVDAISLNISEDIKVINREIRKYGKLISKIPQILVVNRIDLVTDKDLENLTLEVKRITRSSTIFIGKPYLISAVTHQGVKELLFSIEKLLSKMPKKDPESETIPVLTIKDIQKNIFAVKKVKSKYQVSGNKIEKFAQKTDFSNPYAVARLIDIMEKMGIIKEVERAGGTPGAIISIINQEIKY